VGAIKAPAAYWMRDNLTTKEAAEFLNVAVVTMERWRKTKQSPPYYKQGGIIRYPIDDLREWVDKHKRF
tara:strand:- start:115 stop:321 length:207 start_codon:yes stop_codon:yes gene_type:complete